MSLYKIVTLVATPRQNLKTFCTQLRDFLVWLDKSFKVLNKKNVIKFNRTGGYEHLLETLFSSQSGTPYFLEKLNQGNVYVDIMLYNFYDVETLYITDQKKLSEEIRITPDLKAILEDQGEEKKTTRSNIRDKFKALLKKKQENIEHFKDTLRFGNEDNSHIDNYIKRYPFTGLNYLRSLLENDDHRHLKQTILDAAFEEIAIMLKENSPLFPTDVLFVHQAFFNEMKKTCFESQSIETMSFSTIKNNVDTIGKTALTEDSSIHSLTECKDNLEKVIHNRSEKEALLTLIKTQINIRRDAINDHLQLDFNTLMDSNDTF